ncbi:MAG: sugar nucleotide-binding protein [Halobacteriovoraceae bacterium]|nr:sugar nucleotide-binding protein [Halobacteriovoraceae bacterium]
MNKKKTEEVETKRKTILIFGVSSFVGSNLAEFLSKDYRVIGTFHKNPVRIDNVLTVPCNVLVNEEVQAVLFSFLPDYTIYAVGLSSVLFCSKNSEMANALNTNGLLNVARFSQRYKSQVVYISSAYVFWGSDKKYVEVDLPNASTDYGKSKASAEFYLQKSSINYLIFRCSALYGRGLVPIRKTWFEYIQENIHKNKNISGDDHIQVGHLDAYYLAMIIRICFEKKVNNRLFQISSSDCMSYCDFAKLYCQIFNERDDWIVSDKWDFSLHELGAAKDREVNRCYHLDTSNVENFLNIELPSVRESLDFTYQRLNGSNVSQRTSHGGVSYV